jgi:phosphatidate phosphatase APP1
MDMTSRMLDKRYNDPTFKRSTSVEDRNLHRLTKQQALRSRVKLNSAVTQYNQRLSEKKIKTSFKAINIDQVL